MWHARPMRRVWVFGSSGAAILRVAPSAWACDSREGIGICWDGDGFHVKGGAVFGTIGAVVALMCAAYAIWRAGRRRR